MKAIVFAAGLGTRLYPLTADKPKAMVELSGKPLIYYAIEKLKKSGVDELVVNVHHFADVLVNYLNTTDFGVEIRISDERDCLLDTGGGLFKAQQFFTGNEPFIAYNVDVISTVDLREVLKFHNEKSPIATLVVRDRETSRYFRFNEEHQLVGWENLSTGKFTESRPSETYFRRAFSGIQILSPSIFELYPFDGAPFSMTSLYLKLSQDFPIFGFFDRSDYWLDLGKMGQIENAERWIDQKVDFF
jgi:N-acetyl-alpha-D-muramate 1-phosphate uridylyltransferase